MLLIFSLPAPAQQHVPQHQPPVHYNKYKKKDTAKPNLYLIDTLIEPVPMARALFHDNIHKEQLKADEADGKADLHIRNTANNTMSDSLTHALLDSVNRMETMVENMPANGRDGVMENQQKIRGLRALWEMLRQYNSDPKPDATFYVSLVRNMHGMLIASNENKMMEYAHAHTDIYTLDNGKVLFDNHPDVRAYIYTEMGKADPLMMITRLEEFARDTFAAGIIRDAARLKPDLVFNYAMSTNLSLKTAVYKTNDSFVQAIVKIAAQSKSPLKTFPFIGELYLGHTTVAELDTLADHPDRYYEHLVQLRLSGDTIARHTYMDEFQYRSLKYYVRQLNELHEEKEDVRFRCVDSLSPRALFYVMVNGQDEIYTSSFLGTFRRMVDRMKPLKGDQLLDSLHYDHFRTFIRMCAGYNTLTAFLNTMDDTTRTSLMSNFIGNLEFGADNDLEDAVDVADAFGSIRDSALSAFLQKKVKENYELSYREESKKGMFIYSLLARLFQGNDITGSDTGAQVTSARLHLPPINRVRYKDLVSDSEIVYQQVFFYGDKDGQDSYESYMNAYKKDPKWTITEGQYWTTIASNTGKKVVIYANLPLKEPDDDDAQNRLCRFLADSGIHPTIMIHRGHSYHLASTLTRLNPGVRIVILGSCGGYHNLAMVLDRAPDAQIVSSKQTGAMAINEPIIQAMNTHLLAGDDINWISIWQELELYFQKRPDDQERFSDYVPPYKNLGLIFIKAYRKMMEASD